MGDKAYMYHMFVESSSETYRNHFANGSSCGTILLRADIANKNLKAKCILDSTVVVTTTSLKSEYWELYIAFCCLMWNHYERMIGIKLRNGIMWNLIYQKQMQKQSMWNLIYYKQKMQKQITWNLICHKQNTKSTQLRSMSRYLRIRHWQKLLTKFWCVYSLMHSLRSLLNIIAGCMAPSTRHNSVDQI